jgi:cystathionine beta-lyase
VAVLDVPLPALRARRSAKWRTYPADVLPAFVAELDCELAPPVRDVLREAVERGDTGYVAPGDDALAHAFAGFARRRLGWAPEPRHVALVPDVMVGIAELLRRLTRPGDGVVIDPPVYPPFAAVVREVGRRVVEAPLRRDGAGWALDLDAVQAALVAGARAWILCHPHNPTGGVLERPALEAAAELAARHGAVILSDEIHAPLTLPGAPAHVPLAPLAPDTAITLTSASKAFNLAGLKCAVAVTAGERLRREVARLPVEVRYRAGHLGVLASEAAFTHGDAWLDALLDELEANHALLGELLAEQLPGAVRAPARASYLAWLDCAGLGLGDDPARAFLQEGRVALNRGLDFGPGGAAHARLNVGTSPALVREAVERMARAVHAARAREAA